MLQEMYPCRILKRGGGVTPFIKLGKFLLCILHTFLLLLLLLLLLLCYFVVILIR